jgi:hypothetical protein
MTPEPMDGPNVGPSTTWAWRYVRVTPPPEATTQHRRSRSRWHGLYRVPERDKVTITLKWRGGAQAWILVEARGRHGVFHGATALVDVLTEVAQRG